MNKLIYTNALVEDVIDPTDFSKPFDTYGDAQYEYDLIGNITALQRYGVYDGTSLSNNNTDEWVYNYFAGTNRLGQVEVPAGSVNPLATDRNYTYDSNGNVTSDDYRNLLTTNYGRGNFPYGMSTDSDEITYLYNSADQRIYKKVITTDPVTQTQMVRREYYLLSPSGQTLGILDMETDTWTYYINGASRIAKVTPEELQQPRKSIGAETDLRSVSYYITDHLGNTRAVYSATVDCPAIFYTLEYAADYFPYGKTLREFVDGKVERFLSTAHERDQETGFDYRGARYYDSDIGRFLSLDPLADEFLSWSPYNYVLGNPISLIDPDGRSPKDPRSNYEKNKTRAENKFERKLERFKKNNNLYETGDRGVQRGDIPISSQNLHEAYKNSTNFLGRIRGNSRWFQNYENLTGKTSTTTAWESGTASQRMATITPNTNTGSGRIVSIVNINTNSGQLTVNYDNFPIGDKIVIRNTATGQLIYTTLIRRSNTRGSGRTVNFNLGSTDVNPNTQITIIVNPFGNSNRATQFSYNIQVNSNNTVSTNTIIKYEPNP